MKSNMRIAVCAAVLLAPVAAFAQQSSTPLTRAQVRAELAQIVKAGYNPARRDPVHYPADIQAAQARVAAENAANGTRTQSVGH